MAKDLNDRRIQERRASTVRLSTTQALVEVTIVRRVLFIDPANEQHGEDQIDIDLMEVLKTVPSVAQSAEDLTAIQTIFPNIKEAQADRVGRAILRLALGA